MKSKKGSLKKPPSRGNRNEEEQMEDRSGTAEASKGKPAREDPADMRYEVYMSLLDHRIRNAYV